MDKLLKDLEAELAGLKETLAVMAKYAPVPGVLCAPTMEMGLGWKAKSLLAKIEAHHAEIAEAVSNSAPMSELVKLLPGAYYMDPPDGGDVSVIEQIRRMARDAARYRLIRNDRAGQAEDAILVDRYGDVEVKLGDVLDAAIDAAIDAQHNSAREG